MENFENEGKFLVFAFANQAYFFLKIYFDMTVMDIFCPGSNYCNAKNCIILLLL